MPIHDYRARQPRYVHTVRDYDDNEEEGFIQALIPLIGPLLGGLLGGGGGGGGGLLGGLLGGGGGGQQAQGGGMGGMMQSALGSVGRAMGGAGLDPSAAISTAMPQIAEIVRGIVGTVPSPVRDQVREALASHDATSLRLGDVGRSIVDRVGTSVLPQVAAAAGTLQLARTQTDATQEHRSIVQRDRFRAHTVQGIEDLRNRLDRMERALRVGRSRILTGREIDILGGAGLTRAQSPAAVAAAIAPNAVAARDYLG